MADAHSPRKEPSWPNPLKPRAPPPLPRIIEALLFVGGSPLTADRAARRCAALTPEQFKDIVDNLNRDYCRQGRPLPRPSARLVATSCNCSRGFRAVTERLYGSTREAMAVAHRAGCVGVSGSTASAARRRARKSRKPRGGDSGGVLRQLVRLGLIAVQRGEENPREVVYVTTPRFLALFQLRSLDDLPRTQDLQQL